MSQIEKLYNLLKDGRPHRTDEIMSIVYGGDHLGLARVGARIWDLKKKGYEINGRKDKENMTLYWYQLEKIIEKRPAAHPEADKLEEIDKQARLFEVEEGPRIID